MKIISRMQANSRNPRNIRSAKFNRFTVFVSVSLLLHNGRILLLWKIMQERKCNLLITGILEYPEEKRRAQRILKDLDAVVSILCTLTSSITNQSIRYCYRLRKRSANQNRPILLKFGRSYDRTTPS